MREWCLHRRERKNKQLLRAEKRGKLNMTVMGAGISAEEQETWGHCR